MIKLLDILFEIRVVPMNKTLIVTKKQNYGNVISKSYIVDMGNEKFTIHVHKNHATLYPTFHQSSEKYKRIKNFLTLKGVSFEEFNNNKYNSQRPIVNLRIPKKYIYQLPQNG